MNVLLLIPRVFFSGLRYRRIRVAACAFLGLILLSPLLAANTIVRMETTLGNIDIELYDDQAPKTVANFLHYAGRGDYNNSIIHRSIPGFAIQGGGYSYFFPFPGSQYSLYGEIPSDPPVHNEFSLSRSNVRGTIAMAKLPGKPDSATSEWFFNLADNNAPYDPNKSDNEQSLDYQNGGFTVFGNVIDNVLSSGMSVVRAIAAVPTYPPRETCLLPPSPIVTCASVVLPISQPQSQNVPFIDFPLVNYIYDSTTPPKPQISNLVSVIRIPNVASTRTDLGTIPTFTADVDMVFNPALVGTATKDFALKLLESFSSPQNETVHFNNGIHTFTVGGVIGPAGRIVTLHDGATTRPNRYYAYGKTPDNQTDHWYDFSYDGRTGAKIEGDKIVLYFVDGERGDEDLDPTNNSITHTGAQAVVTATTTSSSPASGGCSIAANHKGALRAGDWMLVSLFLAFVELARRRARRNRAQRCSPDAGA